MFLFSLETEVQRFLLEGGVNLYGYLHGLLHSSIHFCDQLCQTPSNEFELIINLKKMTTMIQLPSYKTLFRINFLMHLLIYAKCQDHSP